ncbi:FAD-dependent oxidoreductase [Phytoactinopolyspora alkaliphila]|uniref:FAD-dependent oxidoreductase n=1 Tax=Phytoactinopolyspora alkaliphila TaxID=1783498 RepID=A0A6N9YMY2_9ACTN|nr:FAD-dependent oxidoreductase [Phytoactinopolyspora alkaliphila]NED96297.1 FAD-dependent oxidoreductase [Phytoactinopolyspora alkaliphila]
MNRELQVDLVVVGGGLGGVAAAIAAARRGTRVLLSEPTDWLGGQLTAQAVPPDEHRWIEQFGCTASYRELRDGIRDYYRRWYPLTSAARDQRALNPGSARVSPISSEPRVALAVLEAMIAPHRSAGRIDVRFHHLPVSVTVDADRVTSVSLLDTETGDELTVTAPYVLDATETGDLLPLTDTEYVTGFESQADTGEPSAPAERQPMNMQAITWCFAVDHVDGEDHTIDKPEEYAFWRDYQPPYWPGPMLGMAAPHPITLETRHRIVTPNPDDDLAGLPVGRRSVADRDDLWTFRRVLAYPHFTGGFFTSDISVVNWPMIDYVEGPVFEVDADEAARHLEGARQMSLSFLYWMQTEMPRADGGTGLPGLRLRPDVVGTRDGLAKAPYIRESRRIKAEYTIVEQDVSLAIRGEKGAKTYHDSVGIGMYRLDLHPSTGGDNYIDVASAPFQIPLGALLPVRMKNLLPAAKNIGTTHITNGCYRLHPPEWNIGESAGTLAAYCLEHRVTPHQVRADERHLAQYQKCLTSAGIELAWPSIRGY